MKVRNQVAALGLGMLLLGAGQAPARELPSLATHPFLLHEDAIQRQVDTMPAPMGAGLFSDLPPSKTTESQQAVPAGAKRARMMSIDAATLERLLRAKDLEIDSDGRVRGTPTSFDLNLFDDTPVRIIKLNSYTNEIGHLIVRAMVAQDGGSATFAIKDGAVTGSIGTQGTTFYIEAVGNGEHRILEKAEADDLLQDDAIPLPVPKSAGAAPSGPAIPREAASAAYQYPLRALFTYTADALRVAPDLKAKISLAVDDLNTTLAHSDVSARFEIAGIELTTYSEGATSANLSTVLGDLANGTGDLARIQDMRAALGAHTVTAIVGTDTPNAAGIAYLVDYLDLPDQNITAVAKAAGSNVVHAAYLPGLILAHEMGHTLGATHDRAAHSEPPPAGPTKYNFAYTNVEARFRDSVSYATECTAAGVSCNRIKYYSNPNVTYRGVPVGVAYNTAKAADSTRRMREMLPFVSQFAARLPTSNSTYLSVAVTGSGRVRSTQGGLDCTDMCASVRTSSVTLFATPQSGWYFKRWSGACSGPGDCSVSMSQARSVTAIFAQVMYPGPIFSTSQADSQSFLRFNNTSTTAGTVTVALADSTTGTTLGTWTSPSIPAGTTVQYYIGDIETSFGASFTKSAFYTAGIRASINGDFQHVLWKPTDGTLTNLSTCSSDANQETQQLSYVHTSNLDAGYPSSVIVNNTGSSAMSVSLGIYDSRNGSKLGTYAVGSVAAGRQVVIPVKTMETGALLSPTGGMFHYMVKIEGVFTGFLQHLVDNKQAAVTTDLTTTCALDTSTKMVMSTPQRAGLVFSSANASAQSFLRFYNAGGSTGTVTVTLRNYSTGQVIGTWISPDIAPNMGPQYAISDVEKAMGTFAKPAYYTLSMESTFNGYFWHVLWRPADGTLTNLSTCASGMTAVVSNTDGHYILTGVHTSVLSAGYPSSLVFANTSDTEARAQVYISDATKGHPTLALGSFTTDPIPPKGQLIYSAEALEAKIRYTPSASLYHYSVYAYSLTGFLQHLVNNVQAGVVTDMTTACALPLQ